MHNAISIHSYNDIKRKAYNCVRSIYVLVCAVCNIKKKYNETGEAIESILGLDCISITM